MKNWLLAWMAVLIYRLLSWTWRIEVTEPQAMREHLEQNKGFIMAHWHGDELAVLHLVKRYRLATMTSTSKDGQIVTRLIHALGGVTSKGSSTRGGIGALKGLIRYMKKGHPASMAVDGPRGPIYEVKPGVFELSRMGHAPIFPVGVACQSAYRFERSWNKALLPKPFTRVRVVFGPPIEAIQRHQDPRSEELRKKLSRALTNVRRQAFKQIAPKTQ